MLRRLTITDFALLHKAEIEFQPGLTAITGETGAGKSLLVGALSFLAGGRPPFDAVRENARHAVVEGEFTRDGAPSIILRRQFAADGRSRSFIDDEPVPQKDLAELTSTLLDITSQRAFNRLLDPRLHLDLLDQFAGLMTERVSMQKCATEYGTLSRRKQELERFLAEQTLRHDFLTKQLEEIENLNLLEGEEVEIASELRRLEHFEDLHRDGSRIKALLTGGRDAVEVQLIESSRLLESISLIDATLADLKQELENCLISVREASRRIEERSRPGEYDLDRLETIRQRQHLLTATARKFGGSLESVLQKRDAMRTELNSRSDATGELEDTVYGIEKIVREWVELAEKVSAGRKVASIGIEQKVKASLADLGIGSPQFEVRFDEVVDPEGLIRRDGKRYRLTERGAEDAQFYFSANTGIDVKPLITVASGGELSRIMLALKESLPLQSDEATMLFDEIDTGVSGRTASLVGKKMKKIAEGRQLFVITHLPQIAAMADHHLNVVKSDHAGVTFTEVRKIEGEARVQEIAVMLSGGQVSADAISQARFLLTDR